MTPKEEMMEVLMEWSKAPWMTKVIACHNSPDPVEALLFKTRRVISMNSEVLMSLMEKQQQQN